MSVQTNNNTSPLAVAQHKDEDSFDVKQLFYNILRHWPWIAFSLAVAMALAFLYNRYAEPVYKARAVVMIKDEKKGGTELLDNPLLKELDLAGSGKLVDNEVEVLQSYDLMEAVVRKEQLFVNIKGKGSVTNRSVFAAEVPFTIRVANPDTINNSLEWVMQYEPASFKWKLVFGEKNQSLWLTPKKWYTINGLIFKTDFNPGFHNRDIIPSEPLTDYIISFTPIKKTVNNYSNALAVQPTSKTASIISLELTDKNEVKAQQALNSLINIYNQQGLEDKNKVTTNTLDFLKVRLDIIEKELRSVEGQVERFKSTNKITDVSSEALQYMEQAKEVDQQKAQQQTQLTILESLESSMKNNQGDPKMVPSGSGITEPTLAEMIQNHNRLVLERERQSERLGIKNPIPIDLGKQIGNLRESIVANIANLKTAYKISLNDINSKDAELSVRIKNIPQIEKNLVQIKRDQSVKEQLYFLLLQKREESAITLASTTLDSRSIEKPRSMDMVSPKRTLIWALAILLGLLIPTAIIYFANYLNDKISGKDEIEQKCNAPVLGEISYVKKDSSPIVVQKGSRSIVAEQFRVIRTNISFARPGKSPKVILVTSHRPEEGKSFTSLNLAASYALLNKKVVVLEFDLRKPRLSSALNIKTDKGISNYLSGAISSTDAILQEVPDFDKNFWLLPTGPIPPNPAELILGDRMKTLIDELNRKFDYIILDTPPYSLVTDSSLLAAHTDISVVVLRQGFSFKWVLKELNKKMADNPALSLYTVINRVGEKGHFSNYKQYGYGYSEYFDQPDSQKKKWWSIKKK